MTSNYPNIHTLPSPDDIHIYDLPNGIRLLTRPNLHSQSVVCLGYLSAGSISEPTEKLGLSFFSASALMTGTKQQDFKTLYNTIESLGAHLTFHSGTNTTSFSSQCLAEDLPTMLGILGDVVTSPRFPDKQFNRIKGQILTMLAIRSQETSEMASLEFDKLIYKDHPYERPEQGYIETIKSIEQKDLVEFHKSFYGPRGLVIAIVGAIHPEEAYTQVSNALGSWSNPNQLMQAPLPKLAPTKKATHVHIDIPGKSQTDIVMGTVGPSRNSDDYLPCALGNNILGQFGMMGRIGEAVREKKGLAYYAQSALNSGVGPGAWEIVAGVNPTNVDKTINLIKDEIKYYLEEPVTDEELNDTKSFFIGRLPLSLESNNGVAISLLNMQRYNLGFDHLIKFTNMIQTVSAEQILQSSRNYLSLELLSIASAGSKL